MLLSSVQLLEPSFGSVQGIFIILFGLGGTGGLIFAFMKSYRAKTYEIMEQASDAWKARYDAEAAETSQQDRLIEQLRARLAISEKALQEAVENLAKKETANRQTITDLTSDKMNGDKDDKS